MWWKVVLYFTMASVIVLAFGLPSPMNPSMALGDYQVYRIFYFHVPQAWVASLAFLISIYYAIRFLKTKDMSYDLRAVTACKLGLMFSVLATITGSIFARMTWGEFWNWSEIREVSIFILLIIYGAYFALRSAISEPQTKATLSAALSILFGASALFLIFILPRIYAIFSQHPTDSIIDESGKIAMSPTVGLIFALSLISFTGIFFWIYGLSIRTQKLIQDKFGEQ